MRKNKEKHIERDSSGVFYDGRRISDEDLQKSFLRAMDEAERKAREGDDRYVFVFDMRKEAAKDAPDIMKWKRNRLDDGIKIAVIDQKDPEKPELVGEVAARVYLDHKDKDTLEDLLPGNENIQAAYAEDAVFDIADFSGEPRFDEIEKINYGLMPASHSCVDDAWFNAIEDGDEKGVDIYAGITLGSVTDNLTVEEFIMADNDLVMDYSVETENVREQQEREEDGVEHEYGPVRWTE